MPSPSLSILFEDPFVVVIDKPSGLLVHRGMGRDEVVAMTLVRDRIGAHVYPAHRIDRGTSGVVVFAKSPEVASALQSTFQEGLVEKRYIAFVRGAPDDEGTIDHPVPRDEGGPRVDAVTTYRRLSVREIPGTDRGGEGARRFSLVSACPKTGRFHQIRRHLRHLGHPIIGDVNYGQGLYNRHFRERYGLGRLSLHAMSLALPHPRSGLMMTWIAPFPDDLAGPLRAMGFDDEAWRAATLA